MGQIRINWIDWAKFLGIALVVFGHTEFDESNMFIRKFIYSFHMPLFFFISGFLFKLKEDNFREYLKNSFVSLMIPYLFFFILSIIFNPYFAYITFTKDLMGVFLSFICGSGGEPLSVATWFLASLFLVRVFAYFLIKYKVNIYVSILILALSSIIAYYSPSGRLFVGTFSSFMALPIFMLGHFSKDRQVLNRDLSVTKSFIMAVLSLCLLLLINSVQGEIGVDMSNRNFGNYPYLFYVEALSGIYMIIGISMVLAHFIKNTPFFIKTISTGTIVILGLNLPILWIPRTILRRILHIESGVDGSLVANIFLFFAVFIILYYPIIWMQKRIPFLIGNRK